MFFEPPIKLTPPVYRPPSEWRSLLLQVTIGCSNNKCTYCDMYRSKSYRERPLAELEKEIASAANFYQSRGQTPDKVFLCDGDALGAPTELLEGTLDCLNHHFPEMRRVGIYATAENILEKSHEDLRRLNQKKLEVAYLGLESGDDKVLHMIVKGNTAEDMREASLKIKECGFKLSTIAMLGVGGKKYSKQHVENTAKMLSQTAPHFFSFLTTFAVPGTPYHTMLERGLIQPLTSKELLEEMYGILSKASFELNPIIFRANHVSNQHPLGGNLPRDLDKILETVQGWIEQTPEGVFPTPPSQM